MAAKKEKEPKATEVTIVTTDEDIIVTPQQKSVWETLYPVNVNGHTEKKNDLTYLSWSWAWSEVKNRYPHATFSVREWDGRPYLYDELLGYLVQTSVTIEGETQTMRLPVMDEKNKAMKSQPYKYTVKNPLFKYAKWDVTKNAHIDKYGHVQMETVEKMVEAATMFDINTAIMRCLVKTISLFGLGIYIYAGEDLPAVEKQAQQQTKEDADQRALEAIADINAVQDGEQYAAVKERYMDLLVGDRKHPAVIKAAQLKYQQLFNNNQ